MELLYNDFKLRPLETEMLSTTCQESVRRYIDLLHACGRAM